MKKTINQDWVGTLAADLICEIMQQMSGIDLKGIPNADNPFSSKKLGSVYGETTGDFILRMQLMAEEQLFVRLAENMAGDSVNNQIEMEEYATEFFNIICGRFVSELYNLTGQSARFLPTVYQPQTDMALIEKRRGCNKVTFISDQNEAAVFSWTVASTI